MNLGVLSSQKCMNLGQFCLLFEKKSKLKHFHDFYTAKTILMMHPAPNRAVMLN
jgi:hypothetical protein